MKKTVKKETVNKAQKLLEIIELRRELEKKEKELKTFFKTMLESEVAIDCNGILVTVEERTRKSLDKKELSKIVEIEKFEKVTTYKQLNVKKVG